jgi:hypothetical protein
MSILLSEPTECAGGVFVTWDDDRRPIEHRLQRGDAVLFHSDRVHNVSPVCLDSSSNRNQTYAKLTCCASYQFHLLRAHVQQELSSDPVLYQVLDGERWSLVIELWPHLPLPRGRGHENS